MYASEQRHLDHLYERLDELRTATAAQIPSAGAATPTFAERLARYEAAEERLCFGRLDLVDGRRLYVGRIGLSDPAGADPMLVDWRAPAARPFYAATMAAPLGVVRRRLLITSGRRITAVDDELLSVSSGPSSPDASSPGSSPHASSPGSSPDASSPRSSPDASSPGSSPDASLSGDAALLAAVTAPRTGRMRDVVATLRAEQDAIIRADHRGILVVQGGPGTGKTVVALHRAAYLLYHRPELAGRGVLVVGPSEVFREYISQVLPGLGETSLVTATIAGLLPGYAATREEPPEVAEIKGRIAMADVLAVALRTHQTARTGIGPDLGPEIGAGDVRHAVERARACGLAHQPSRAVFTAALAERLADRTLSEAARQEAEVEEVLAAAGVDEAVTRDLVELGLADTGQDDDAQVDPAALRRAFAADPAVLAATDACWPVLTAAQLVDEVLADPDRFAATLDPADRKIVRRAPGGGWSAADIPLLDEAADLIGDDGPKMSYPGPNVSPPSAGVGEVAAAAAGVETAVRHGTVTDCENVAGPEMAAGFGTATSPGTVTGHGTVAGPGTLAERAALDRRWAYGHVIVDEAQELSAMAWRMVLRRVPGRSMTLAGDIAQTSAPGGAQSWEGALRPHAGERWRAVRLSVNYRTPAEIMDAASRLVPGHGVPESVRSSGVPPWRFEVTESELIAEVSRLAAEETLPGQVAIIAPRHRLAGLAARVPGRATTRVLGVDQAKGLEFDSVLIADPAGILAASPRGRNDLYVAMTRATHRLGLLHPGPPPVEIAHLVSRPSAPTSADGPPRAPRSDSSPSGTACG